MAATAHEGRRGGREARRQARTAITIRALPVLERAIPVYEVLNQEGLEMIHEASLQILEQIGIDFRDTEAAKMWQDAGAEVERFRVRIPRQLLMSLVAKNPSRFTVHARNPLRSTEIGGNKVAFAPTYGSPFVYDFDNQRRYGTLSDLNQFHKLAYMAPAMHNTGAVICEPVDIPIPKRHLHITYSAMKHSDKPFMGPVTAPERAEDAVRMARILFGDAYVDEHTVVMALVNCNSPLVWDETMLGALKVYARAGQSVIVSPFVLAGANTPASAVGSVAQLNAEALAGIAFAQLCRPGAPMVYGHFLAAVSMRSGAPMAGTPEIAFMNLMIGQLARKYGLPLRSSGMIAGSKRVDAQAAYELIQTMWAVFSPAPTTSCTRPAGTRPGLAPRSPSSCSTASRSRCSTSWARAPSSATSRQRSRRSARSARAATISARRTPASTSRARSSCPSCSTTTASSSGSWTVPRTRTSAASRPPATSSTTTSPLPSTPRSMKPSWRSSASARPSCRTA